MEELIPFIKDLAPWFKRGVLALEQIASYAGGQKISYGRGILTEGETVKTPIYHVGRFGANRFLASNFDSAGNAQSVEGNLLEGTLCGATYFMKPRDEARNREKDSHKLQVHLMTDNGPMTLEFGAETACAAGVVRGCQNLIDMGYPLLSDRIVISFRPGQQKAVLADILDSAGNPVFQGKGTGRKWKVDGAGVERQPWYLEVHNLTGCLSEMGAKQFDYDPSQGIADSDTANFESDAVQSNDQLDMSDIIAQTDVELRRLQWTVQQGREYLETTYNKRSRHDLTDQELIAFLLYLETQPSPQP